MINTKKTFLSLSILFFSLSILGAGCFGASTSKKTSPDLGVWKTVDNGKTWLHKKALVDGPKVTADAGKLSVQDLIIDPQNRLVLYMATKNNGLLYSLDGGTAWQKFKSLEAKNITSVAVDPKDKCTIYATSQNKLYQTTTCGRDWLVRYYHPNIKTKFNAILIDWFNPTTIYIGTQEGDVLKSADQGENWEMLKQLSAPVTSLAISKQDSRVIYIGTYGNGLWKSLDGGVTWVQIYKEFNQIRDARRIHQVSVDSMDSNILYLVHRSGIVKTIDQGATWQSLKLVDKPKRDSIRELAIDPNNNQRIAYITYNSIVISNNGGQSWDAKKIPSNNYGSTITFDPKDGKILYLGITQGGRR